ncbi:MAG: hypothetical protein N2D54_06560, partial [Chloroflexota bacterium]
MKKTIRFQVVVFVIIRTIMNTLYRMIYPFFNALESGLGVSYLQLTQALTWRAVVGFFTPVFASIADQRGRKTGMLFGVGLHIMGLAVLVF